MSEPPSSPFDTHPGGSAAEPQVDAPAAHGAAQPRMAAARLVATIEAEIVPRMLLAVSSACRRLGGTASAPSFPDAADAAELARLLLMHDVPVALAFIEMLRTRGVSPGQICLDVCAPAARALARMWERQDCDFTQFELGMARLGSVLDKVMQVRRDPA